MSSKDVGGKYTVQGKKAQAAGELSLSLLLCVPSHPSITLLPTSITALCTNSSVKIYRLLGRWLWSWAQVLLPLYTAGIMCQNLFPPSRPCLPPVPPPLLLTPGPLQHNI